MTASDALSGITRFGVSLGRLITWYRRWTDVLKNEDDADVPVDFAESGCFPGSWRV